MFESLHNEAVVWTVQCHRERARTGCYLPITHWACSGRSARRFGQVRFAFILYLILRCLSSFSSFFSHKKWHLYFPIISWKIQNFSFTRMQLTDTMSRTVPPQCSYMYMPDAMFDFSKKDPPVEMLRPRQHNKRAEGGDTSMESSPEDISSMCCFSWICNIKFGQS